MLFLEYCSSLFFYIRNLFEFFVIEKTFHIGTHYGKKQLSCWRFGECHPIWLITSLLMRHKK